MHQRASGKVHATVVSQSGEGNADISNRIPDGQVNVQAVSPEVLIAWSILSAMNLPDCTPPCDSDFSLRCQ
jgi:hypothetical protein